MAARRIRRSQQQARWRGADRPALLRKLRRLEPSLGPVAMTMAPGREKMSEVILDFAQPLTEMTDGPIDQKNALALAIVAWNLALADGTERTHEKLHDLAVQIAPEHAAGLAEILGVMVLRKQKYFGDNNRFVVSYEFTDCGDELQFSVASTLQ